MATSNDNSQGLQTRTSLLRTRAVSFCNAFLQSTPPHAILDEFFTTTPAPSITEHGPQWATARLPFLGKTFTGRDPSRAEQRAGSCDDYFRLLSKTLEFKAEASGFPPPEEFVVDVDALPLGSESSGALKARIGVVMVVGWAEFASVRTGKSWKETFVHRLSGFDEQGKFERWDIWADPMSAWMAVGGSDIPD